MVHIAFVRGGESEKYHRFRYFGDGMMATYGFEDRLSQRLQTISVRTTETAGRTGPTTWPLSKLTVRRMSRWRARHSSVALCDQSTALECCVAKTTIRASSPGSSERRRSPSRVRTTCSGEFLLFYPLGLSKDLLTSAIPEARGFGFRPETRNGARAFCLAGFAITGSSPASS
jgi:hypothetical protein